VEMHDAICCSLPASTNTTPLLLHYKLHNLWGRMHNNVLVYAKTIGYVGYIGTNKSETNQRS